MHLPDDIGSGRSGNQKPNRLKNKSTRSTFILYREEGLVKKNVETWGSSVDASDAARTIVALPLPLLFMSMPLLANAKSSRLLTNASASFSAKRRRRGRCFGGDGGDNITGSGFEKEGGVPETATHADDHDGDQQRGRQSEGTGGDEGTRFNGVDLVQSVVGSRTNAVRVTSRFDLKEIRLFLKNDAVQSSRLALDDIAGHGWGADDEDKDREKKEEEARRP
jgi:hypothetical protein